MQVVMMGATGAVGGQVVDTLLKLPSVQKLTLLGRNLLPNLQTEIVHQYPIDIFEPFSYMPYLHQHSVAICTLGVGQPSKISRSEFLKIDKHAVISFATACKQAGVIHFELLSSVGANSKSKSFYLRAKGELIDEIKLLDFPRFSVFEPSMILTPKNRYGFMQGFLLKFWPLLNPLLAGKLNKYRGIKVAKLGQAMALNILNSQVGVEHLNWSDFQRISSAHPATKQ